MRIVYKSIRLPGDGAPTPEPGVRMLRLSGGTWNK
nr:MAG TPA: hypothetical protein [Caudoviricetes sp.]